MTAAEEWYKGLQEDYRAAAEDAMRHSHEPSPSFRLGDMGYVYDSGAYTTRDDDRPCTDCRASNLVPSCLDCNTKRVQS